MRFLKSNKNGFTVLELLVVIAIMGLLSVIVLFNYRTFGDQVAVSNLAYDIAQSIREAQNFGLSTKSDFDSNGYGNIYGVRFGAMQLGGAATHYFLYFDRNNSATTTPVTKVVGYNGDLANTGHPYTNSCATLLPVTSPNPPEECVKIYTITGGNKIKQICVIDGTAPGVDKCVLAGAADSPRFIEINFKRPSPDAIIFDYTGPIATPTVQVETKPVRIDVTNASGSVVKSITVTQTGQISVK